MIEASLLSRLSLGETALNPEATTPEIAERRIVETLHSRDDGLERHRRISLIHRK